MSLLNQVLQDLDARSSDGAAAAALHTAAPSVVEHAAADFELDRRGVTTFVWGMLALVLVSAFAVWTWKASWFHLADTMMPAESLQSADQITAAIGAARPQQEVEKGSVIVSSPLIVEPDVTAADSRSDRPALVDPTSVPPAIVAAPSAPKETTSDSLAGKSGDESRDGRYLALRNDRVADLPTSAMPAKANNAQAVIRRRAADALALARSAIASGDLAEAEHILQEQLQRRPADRVARELLIGLMLRGDRQAQALRQLDSGLRHHPGHATFVLIKARLLAEAGNTAGAIELLRQDQEPGMDTVQKRQMLAALYQKARQFTEAAEQYRGLVEANSGSATAWVGLAISLDALGDPDASEAYRRALSIGGLPDAADAYARRRVEELR
jgi:tetratricopeptide (TPR) repeat protein